MNELVEFQYREFYDIPRLFVVKYHGRHFLFDGSFSDDLDEYPDQYEVFLMPSLRDIELAGSWEHLKDRAIQSFGCVPITAVSFDPSKRKMIDASILGDFSRQVA